MPVKEVRELHGLKKFSVDRVYSLGLTDKPLTEAKKEHNRAVKRNAEVGDEYNDLQLKLCCLLDDKIFLAESLNFVASKVIGDNKWRENWLEQTGEAIRVRNGLLSESRGWGHLYL
jgi:hypothetical protein